MMVKEQTEKLYREIMASYPTGVTIMTTTDENNKPIGLTVNSFTSVSLEPLMILWCIGKESGSIESFKNSQRFAVNILAGDQQDACWVFASSKEKDRFAKVDWEFSLNNLPILKDVFGVLECEKVEQIDAGDHIIFLGEVISLDKKNSDPMLYYRRNVGAVPENWVG
ncbi:oxygenase [Pueribacillus theae]|uniref:Oxygenase n=1 Tax=Pueribacillus theae TaxID=2171751 RepID=A0A2U1JSH1_9BACI|nr:flavin reductase family protein [Pueribacillus theae]PWA07823.1 oxygenase [Pueribacillus theae]